MSTDFIPSKDADFDPWFNNLCGYATQMTAGDAPQWTHIPAAEVAKLNAADAAWHTAWEAVLKPHTPVETEAKNDARKAAESVIRPFKRRYLDDPPVTNADRVAMGLPVRDSTRTPGAEPKPHGVHGAEIRWALLDHPPAGEDELTHSEFDTATPFTLRFSEGERGKRLYYALRWESSTNLKGPWSGIYSAVIP